MNEAVGSINAGINSMNPNTNDRYRSTLFGDFAIDLGNGTFSGDQLTWKINDEFTGVNFK